MNELKPCPFCGGAAEMRSMRGAYWVKCSQCRARAPVLDSEQAAAAMWNTRGVQDGVHAVQIREEGHHGDS